MRKFLLVAAVILVGSATANAQDEYPAAEIFGGYSYFNADLVDRESLHGWGLSFAGNLGPVVGLVAEFSGHYGETDLLGTRDVDVYTFLFGPRFSARSERATGFAHVLLGGARTSIDGFGSDTDFAMAIGGGVDVNASRNIAIRLVQVDWVPIRASGSWFHNARVQAGIVFKVGEF